MVVGKRVTGPSHAVSAGCPGREKSPGGEAGPAGCLGRLCASGGPGVTAISDLDRFVAAAAAGDEWMLSTWIQF